MRKIFAVLLIAALAVSMVWFGCGKEPSVTAPTTESESAAKLSGIPPGIERAMAVQDQHTDRIMGIRGVVGTATGLGPEGRPAVLVLTKARGVAGIPRTLDGVPVIVKVTGEIRALQVGDPDPTSRFPRPVPIGVSTGHPDITAGTIGARVKDLQGNVYALSNNHVYADENNAAIGDNVLQPGIYDGGIDPGDAIGTLHDFEPIVFHPRASNQIDAAIALSSTSLLGNVTPTDGYGTPSSATVPEALGQMVKKYGRTTSLTEGSITGINATLRVSYSSGKAIFVDQIMIVANEGSFSEGGDSGSLVVTDPGCNPVGLLFAGSSTVTIANRIGLVLERFNVTIDDGSGQGNIPPNADFSFTTSGLTVGFTDQSFDPDGSLMAWNWSFDDDATSTEQNPTHTYATGGTYAVTLTVTDNEGATGFKSSDVTVTEQGTAPTISECDPNNGSPGERLIVVVTGTNFQDGATVDFGGAGIVVQGVSFVGSSQLDVKINIQRRATTGSRDVTVTNPDGQSGSGIGVFSVN